MPRRTWAAGGERGVAGGGDPAGGGNHERGKEPGAEDRRGGEQAGLGHLNHRISGARERSTDITYRRFLGRA
jgi:hypothetical protein